MKKFSLILLFLLILRVTTFFLSKPNVKIGDTVRISGVITEIRYESVFKTKTGERKVEIVVNGDYVVEMMAGVSEAMSLSNGAVEPLQIKHKKIVVVGKVGDRQIINAQNFQISSNGILEKLQLYFDDIRENVKSVYFKYLPDEEAQIVSGIFLGDAKGISSEMYAAFRQTGTLHLFAASGMNLVLFCGFWVVALNLFFKRRQAVLLSIFTCIFYIFLTGFSASILRAGIMFIFASFGYVIGRPIRPISNLAKSAGFLLFLSPGLVTNLGFQLSVLSTLAIISMSGQLKGNPPSLKASEGRRSLKVKVGERRIGLISQISRIGFSFWSVISADFAVSTACFLFTAPLIMFSFGQINLISPFVNILILWSVDLIMVFGGALAVFNYIFPKIIASFLINALIFVFYPIILWFKTVVMVFSNLNIGVINLGEGSSLSSLLVFSLVMWTVFLVFQKKQNAVDRTKSKQ